MLALVRKAALLLAMLIALPAGALAAQAVPLAAEGIGCGSTRACTPLSGGALVSTSRSSCTAGLPVRGRSGRWYVLTAGHCVAAAGGATWRQGRLELGRGTRWEYGGLGTEGGAGGSDLGLIEVSANAAVWQARSRVLVLDAGGARRDAITTARDARAGERVCVTAGRTGVTRCGRVVRTGAALSYASPGLATRRIGRLALVQGVCLNPGDSGSPVYAGHALVGIATARSTSGCWFWYATVAGTLARYGVTVAG